MINSNESRLGQKRIDRVYISLIAMTCFAPLLSWLITDNTTLRIIEFLFFLSVWYNLWILKRKGELVSYSGFTKYLIISLTIVLWGIILRGSFSTDNVKDFLLHLIRSAMTCFIPMILLYLPNYKYQNRILRIFYYASILYLPLVLLNVDSGLVMINTDRPWAGEYIGAFLPFFAAFLLGLSYGRFTQKERLLLFSIWGVYFILMLLNARRNVSFTLALYLIIAYFYNMFKQGLSSKKLISVVVFALISLFLMLNFEQFALGPFKGMYKRANEDTRSQVEELMLADFATSPTEDWILGRGLDGGYYQEMRDIDTGEISTNRQVIETGYLNMVLKGGIIFDVIVVLLIILAIRNAFRQNDNDSYYFGIILITYLIDNYTTNPIYIFNSRSIIFWFIINVMLSNRKVNVINKRIY